MYRLLLRLACAALAPLVAGCAGSIIPSHIHDPERARRTTKLAGILDVYGQNAPSIYETMLKSSRAIAAEQDKVLAELANSRAAAREQLLPFKTSARLVNDKRDIQKRATRVRDLLRDEANKYLKEQKIVAQNAADADSAIAEARKALGAAKQDVTNWNASIALLQAGIAELPSMAASSANDSRQKGLDKVQERLRDVGGKQVEFVDADGVQQKREIKDILQDQINAAAKDEADSVRIPDAPGATLTILTLAVDLAKIQKQSAEARLVQISRRLALYERVKAEAVLADELLKGVNFQPVNRSEKNVPFEQDVVRLVYGARRAQRTVQDTEQALADAQRAAAEADSRRPQPSDDDLNKLKGVVEDNRRRVMTALQESDRKMLALSNNLLMLRKLAVADSILFRAELGLERDSARLNHEESILTAQVTDLAWRTALKAGVTVLDQYEQGGFKAEDLANIIRIAQTVALGIIAGKVP